MIVSDIMRLKSDAFADGETLPKRFTCDGSNISPPLRWAGAPPDAKSFAIICCDPDAPAGTRYHWAIFDLPAAARELKQGRVGTAAAAQEAINDFGDRGYGGPCPPHGHGNHRYLFTIYALNVPKLDVPAAANCRAIERAAKSHAVAIAELTGLYQR